jgi:hypothetical protein
MAGADPNDYSGQYNTQLTPEQEAQFMAAFGNRQRDLYDYDLRGAWLSGAAKAKNGHLPDTYKKPNHPTFSAESKYSSPDAPGGKWVDLGNGKYQFIASPQNLKHYGKQGLEQYFKLREPDSVLILPGGNHLAQPIAPSVNAFSGKR